MTDEMTQNTSKHDSSLQMKQSEGHTGSRGCTAAASLDLKSAEKGKSGGQRKVEDVPRAPGPPYFSNDKLDPAVYPEDLAATIGGPYNTLKIDKGSRLPMEDVTDDEDPSIMDTDINGITEDTSTKRQCSPTSSVSGPQKRLKVTGGRPPVARKITWDLDSDDGRMVALKDKGLTDQEVADRLRAEGRVDYHPKTISSRYRRIQRALEVQRERELDNGTCSWQGSDDELLKAAVIAVDKEIEALKTKADENKWIYVSRHLKTLLPHSRYSSGACKKRYYAFKAATVNVPVDEASGHDEGETNPHPDINQASFGTFVDSNFEFLLDKHSTSLGTGEALKDDNADQRLRK